jgi:acyl-CoA synthetase (AMP-forming)/AMP-acid ligase II
VSSDVEMARRLLKLKGEINANYTKGYNVVMFWYDALKRNPTKPALVMQEDSGEVRTFTFADVERESNQMASFLASQGLARGDTCALMMENRPEFVISWLGMAKLGVKVAMINTSIKEKGLVHCLKISKSKMVLFGAELQEPMGAIKDQLDGMMLFCRDGTTSFCPSADSLLKQASSQPPDGKITANITMSDPFGYIYTSGTTGLPKAAVILHSKTFAFGGLMCNSFLVRPDDVVLTVLPLFHSAGGGLGIGMMLYCGCTVVLRKKFSATNFFADCVKHKVTVVQYIGELCRYLVSSPPSPNDQKHQVSDWQRLAPRHLEHVPNEVQHPGNRRVLRRHGGQRGLG